MKLWDPCQHFASTARPSGDRPHPRLTIRSFGVTMHRDALDTNAIWLAYSLFLHFFQEPWFDPTPKRLLGSREICQGHKKASMLGS
jgi:hypothetical protein